MADWGSGHWPHPSLQVLRTALGYLWQSVNRAAVRMLHLPIVMGWDPPLIGHPLLLGVTSVPADTSLLCPSDRENLFPEGDDQQTVRSGDSGAARGQNKTPGRADRRGGRASQGAE